MSDTEENKKKAEATAAETAKKKAEQQERAYLQRIHQLTKDREFHESSFNRLQLKISGWIPGGAPTAFPPATPTRPELKLMERELELVYSEQKSTSRSLFLTCHGADYTNDHEDKFTKIFSNIEKYIALVQDLLEHLYPAQTTTQPPPATTVINPSAVTVTPYREKVDLPCFDGTITKWRAFHDLFLHKVKVEGIVSGASKLALLQVKLVGEAANVIPSVALTDANFDPAWAYLVQRFEDKRDLIHAHIEEFDKFPSLTSESGRGLRSLLDLINNMTMSLNNIGVNLSQSDVFIVYYAVKKLDSKTRTWWALAPKSDIATVKELTGFLDTRSKALLENNPSSNPSSSFSKPPNSSQPGSSKKTHHVSSSTSKCSYCSGAHMIWICPDFKALTVQGRWDSVRAKHLCFNCLSQHRDRGPCPSKYTCRHEDCGKPHHTLLHDDKKPSATGGGASKQTETRKVSFKSKASSHSRVISEQSESVAILGTLIVDVKDSNGVKQPCRVLVDDGSEVSFVTSACLQRLGLKGQKFYTPITVVGNTSGRPSRAKIQLTIESRTEQYALMLDAFVLRKLTGLVPASNCLSDWPHLRGLRLSDTEYFKAEECDILLGGKKSGHITLPQVIQDYSNPDAPVAWNTRFGWMVKGEAPPTSHSSHPIAPRCNRVSITTSPREEICAFWDHEEVEDSKQNMSLEDMACESHFTRTHSRNTDGTYTVQLPFKRSPNELGKSREQAVARFLRLEERLGKNPAMKAEYTKVIHEFLELGYLEPVPAEENGPPPTSYYMPHREVLKDSSSTKVRVVYDASAPTSSKISLNDALHVGPKLQTDLFDLLIRFMKHRIAMSADIWKFYPQTSVHPNDRDFQRLVWREASTQPLRDYRMTRVTFGVAAAPFLAIRALHQMADDTEELSPHVVDTIKSDFLVDNLLSGATDVEAALTLQTELLTAMHLGGLKLLKWTSNSPEVLAAVPPELRDPNATLAIDEGDFIKTIGILWNPREDTFSVQVNVPPHPPKTTKRTILSSIARTFDPLNWLCPVTMTSKLLLQELWKAKVTWDEPIPAAIHKKWMKYCDELPQLSKFKIPRCAFAPPTPTSKNWTHQLHGFCDGSDVAHSACVYIRTVDAAGNVASRLLTAKSRVNPVAKLTTPRSELCGAVLLANLVTAVQKAVSVPFTSMHCWTDSNVVLGRLSPEKKLPRYELNRIKTILQLLPPNHWHHVKGQENPADAPSRGITASSLLNHPLWLHGPQWLLGHIPDLAIPVAARTASITPVPVSDMIRKFSSHWKVRRCMAIVLRFVHNAQPKKYSRTTGKISVSELESALDTIVRIIQREEFPQELEDCARSLPLKSSVKFLSPFIDQAGILRVGGRLERAEIPFRQKHPALLPKDHPFTEAMVRELHIAHLHPGQTLLMSIVREQFWVRRLRDLVTKVIHKCVVCHRFRAAKSSQLMAQLPPSRVNPAPPFTHTGMDYAGPFSLALRTGRKPPMTTAYVALFICMATKAIHLELASDLSTATFLAALQRFISRRGAPTDLYSDGGTNFVGAKSELAELRGFLESSSHLDAVNQLLTSKGTRFHFNPPAAPHHGGLWEAGVKSMKHHLRRVIGSRNLTIEEFNTLLCRVEAILNSRPLTPMSNDPNDCSVLTPGHFLIGRPLVALPHPDLRDLNESRLDRWQRVEVMTQHLWNAWSRDYLSQLQARPKWYAPCPNLEPGTLVLIGDDTAFGPQQWKLGRITATSPGKDGKTRVCDVRTNISSKKPMGSILTRPVTKLSPLPIYS